MWWPENNRLSCKNTYKELSINVDFSEVDINLPAPDGEDAEVTREQVHGIRDGDHKVIHGQSGVNRIIKSAFADNT